MPLATLGDGDLMMGINALWTAAHHDVPLLIVVANNRAYYNDVVHQETVARERDRPVENKWVGQRLDQPLVDIAAMARAQGFQAEGPITDAAVLQDSLQRALESVAQGIPVLLDVVVEAGYVSSVVDFDGDAQPRGKKGEA
ncbi:thiamine pyrophosphate-dependent enzyme [Billgrantia sulfidoxydans]|uniref:thiamine pyrophosphate-dependent enzyme n=1 Tax=Billgrantia sulfidoxydans TaxID=2733484 RepID=UPI001F5E839A|nr:thiamine pyrophosphate-dependent enzyme [Halomonas sulfidoxydans]